MQLHVVPRMPRLPVRSIEKESAAGSFGRPRPARAAMVGPPANAPRDLLTFVWLAVSVERRRGLRRVGVERKGSTKKFLVAAMATAALVAAALSFGLAADPASAHRSGCHRWHTCPSDLATYRWRGLLCVSQRHRAEFGPSFRRRVVYAGLTYYCKR